MIFPTGERSILFIPRQYWFFGICNFTDKPLLVIVDLIKVAPKRGSWVYRVYDPVRFKKLNLRRFFQLFCAPPFRHIDTVRIARCFLVGTLLTGTNKKIKGVKAIYKDIKKLEEEKYDKETF